VVYSTRATLEDVAGRLVERNQSLRNALRQILAPDELHDEGARAPALFDAINRRDVGVIEGGQRLRLTREARHAIRVGGKHVGQDVDGDVAVQPRVPRPVHLAHTALPDGRDDLLHTDKNAARQCNAITREPCRGGTT
jgi:hypothetical protein